MAGLGAVQFGSGKRRITLGEGIFGRRNTFAYWVRDCSGAGGAQGLRVYIKGFHVFWSPDVPYDLLVRALRSYRGKLESIRNSVSRETIYGSEVDHLAWDF
jgi:hypothetical protein